MSKVIKSIEDTEEFEALEIIELAIDDIDSLTRAFDMITTVCTELSNRADTREQDELIVH